LRGCPKGSDLLHLAPLSDGGPGKPGNGYRDCHNRGPRVGYAARDVPAAQPKRPLRAASTPVAAGLCGRCPEPCGHTKAGLEGSSSHLPVCSLVDRLRG